MIGEEKDWIEKEKRIVVINLSHVRFQLYEESIELRARLSEFGNFVEDHDEFFVIRLLSGRKSTINKSKSTAVLLVRKEYSNYHVHCQDFDISLDLEFIKNLLTKNSSIWFYFGHMSFEFVQ